MQAQAKKLELVAQETKLQAIILEVERNIDLVKEQHIQHLHTLNNIKKEHAVLTDAMSKKVQKNLTFKTKLEDDLLNAENEAKQLIRTQELQVLSVQEAKQTAVRIQQEKLTSDKRAEGKETLSAEKGLLEQNPTLQPPPPPTSAPSVPFVPSASLPPPPPPPPKPVTTPSTHQKSVATPSTHQKAAASSLKTNGRDTAARPPSGGVDLGIILTGRGGLKKTENSFLVNDTEKNGIAKTADFLEADQRKKISETLGNEAAAGIFLYCCCYYYSSGERTKIKKNE